MTMFRVKCPWCKGEYFSGSYDPPEPPDEPCEVCMNEFTVSLWYWVWWHTFRHIRNLVAMIRHGMLIIMLKDELPYLWRKWKRQLVKLMK
jgi:hypothetical protein